MAYFLALLPDRIARARLADALKALEGAEGAGHRLELRASWPELEHAARTDCPEILVFDPNGGARLHSQSPARFHLAFPRVYLIAYGDFGSASAQEILGLAHGGVRQVAQRGIDDSPVGLHHLLVGALRETLAGYVLTALADHLPPDIVHVVRILLGHIDGRITPVEAARLCHCHPKTLRDRLRRAGLPSTDQLMTWVRLLAAAHLMRDPGRSVEEVAFRLGFPSGNALGNQMRRYAGLGPKELAAAGGMDRVLVSFRERCRAGQTQAELVLAGD